MKRQANYLITYKLYLNWNYFHRIQTNFALQVASLKDVHFSNAAPLNGRKACVTKFLEAVPFIKGKAWELVGTFVVFETYGRYQKISHLTDSI